MAYSFSSCSARSLRLAFWRPAPSSQRPASHSSACGSRRCEPSRESRFRAPVHRPSKRTGSDHAPLGSLVSWPVPPNVSSISRRGASAVRPSLLVTATAPQIPECQGIAEPVRRGNAVFPLLTRTSAEQVGRARGGRRAPRPRPISCESGTGIPPGGRRRPPRRRPGGPSASQSRRRARIPSPAAVQSHAHRGRRKGRSSRGRDGRFVERVSASRSLASLKS